MPHHASISGALVAPLAAFVALALAPAATLAANCAGTSTGMIPLTDLGPGLYQGEQGGLYAGGSNQRPAAHESAGLAIAGAIAPLDTLGEPDPANGRIVLISIGMSNATQEFSAFVPKANADPARNPRVRVIDCAQGGQSANRIADPNAAYWDFVFSRLRINGSAPAQVQVAWIKEADPGPSGGFLPAAEKLRDELGTIVRILKDKLPNLKLAYLTSRIYAGYASTSLNPEPYAYESAFSVKWLIDAQASGADSLNHDSAHGPVEAPWLSWGPYLWADGLAPRGDGLTWLCSDFAEDGTHPAAGGREKVANALLAFFKTDATAVPWFMASGTVGVGAPQPTLALTVAPNPARGAAEVSFTPPAFEPWSLEVVDLAGRRVKLLGAGAGTGAAERRRWDVRTTTGDPAPAGVYWVRLAVRGASSARRVVLLDPR